MAPTQRLLVPTGNIAGPEQQYPVIPKPSITHLPSARTASFAVFHPAPRSSATRATVRCCTTTPSSAQRSPRREIFARGSAARVVS